MVGDHPQHIILMYIEVFLVEFNDCLHNGPFNGIDTLSLLFELKP